MIHSNQQQLATDGENVSIISCPACGTAKMEIMPTDACVFFYCCTGCGAMLRPLPGDCCVFCSYGDRPCPPIACELATKDEL